ncbi:hypothetical protein MUN89_15760 [Halobacillus salinarum]|uniref:Uncharacterized protein n=1 Tax=Halobacillus salinarum TaxID=2932257 RepID=A0ABY4EGV2_9BACI|nr:hypothetical protein [Halobacillus salinarum]UOQ43366.1 hypothetical protein MUN89_15760 [Halobacillus salinarum]
MDGHLQVLEQLLTTAFLLTHTNWIDFQHFQDGLPIQLEKHDGDLQLIKNSRLDEYIQKNCQFSNWNHFICYLLEEHSVRKLGYSLIDYGKHS